MAKAITLSKHARAIALERQVDILRSAIVLGCGGALILAGQPFSF